MALTAAHSAAARRTRLTVMVGPGESVLIARRAEAAGLSVSAFLRERALDAPAEDEAALRKVDLLVVRMEAELDDAVVELAAAMARLDAA
jgi:uncharacterized protein (DUF1778 family)